VPNSARKWKEKKEKKENRASAVTTICLQSRHSDWMIGLTSLRNEKVFRIFLSAINQKKHTHTKSKEKTR